MINELYLYACPKLSEQHKSPLSMLYLVLVTVIFSSFTLFFGNIAFGVVLSTVYLGLSLLSFIDKDVKSKYMKLVTLCVFDISIVCIYLFSKVYPGYQLAFWSIILGVILTIIYEITEIYKIKNKLYSSTSKSKKNLSVISAPVLFLVILIFRFIRKIPSTQYLVVIILIFLSSMTILGGVISLQKLIVYLMVRNKIKDKLIDKTDIT